MAKSSLYYAAAVLDPAAIKCQRGAPSSSFSVAMEPGDQTGRDPSAPIARASVYKRMHGYVPSHPAMRSTLIVSGPNISKGRNLKVVDMYAVAPSTARLLGVKLPTVEAPAVF